MANEAKKDEARSPRVVAIRTSAAVNVAGSERTHLGLDVAWVKNSLPSLTLEHAGGAMVYVGWTERHGDLGPRRHRKLVHCQEVEFEPTPA
jgi:hypothetical protein